MKIDGGCHCGAIRYEAEIDPASVSVCHCRDCQQFSGSPWRASVRARAEDVRVTGSPRVYVKVAESGTRRGQAFCADCGSPLYAFSPDNPRVFSFRLGGVNQRAALPPTSQIWCESALPWASDITALPARPRQ